jgi:hypothetical protein
MNVLNSHNSKVDQFKRALCRLYKTVDGKEVLDALKELNMQHTCIGKDPYMTYYKLGKSELVGSLFEIINNPI